MDRGTVVRAAALFGALGHPLRVRIVSLVVDRERSVGEIAAALDMPQSTASQHLSVLTRVGLLAVSPKGTTRLYRARGPRVAKVLELVGEFCAVHGLQGEPEVDE